MLKRKNEIKNSIQWFFWRVTQKNGGHFIPRSPVHTSANVTQPRCCWYSPPLNHLLRRNGCGRENHLNSLSLFSVNVTSLWGISKKGVRVVHLWIWKGPYRLWSLSGVSWPKSSQAHHWYLYRSLHRHWQDTCLYLLCCSWKSVNSTVSFKGLGSCLPHCFCHRS